MPRDGVGQYNLPDPPVVTGTVISSVDENDTRDDIAAALTGSVARDGQSAMTGNLPMATFKLTGLGAGAALTDSLSLGQAQGGNFAWGGTAGGTADVITIAPTPAPTAYVAGLAMEFIAAGTNTTTPTINPSSLGAKSVARSSDGAALVGGEIVSGARVRVVYDGTNWVMQQVRVPLSPVISGGIGPFNSTIGGSLQLPGGATVRYAYYAQLYVAATGVFTLNQIAGTAVGGTVLDPGSPSNQWFGFYWRIA